MSVIRNRIVGCSLGGSSPVAAARDFVYSTHDSCAAQCELHRTRTWAVAASGDELTGAAVRRQRVREWFASGPDVLAWICGAGRPKNVSVSMTLP